MREPRTGEMVLFTVQDYMSGGSIDRRLWHTARDSVTWTERLQWARDIAEGMRAIHERGYSHRDLKSLNVLYDTSTGEAKVADFGMTRQTGNHVQQKQPPASASSSRVSANSLRALAQDLATTPQVMSAPPEGDECALR